RRRQCTAGFRQRHPARLGGGTVSARCRAQSRASPFADVEISKLCAITSFRVGSAPAGRFLAASSSNSLPGGRLFSLMENQCRENYAPSNAFRFISPQPPLPVRV